MSSTRYIKQSLGFVWRSSKKWTILLLLSQVIQAILPLAMLYLTKLIVDSITEIKQSGDFQIILTYILIFGVVHLIQALVQNYQVLISETQQQLVSDYMSTVIIDKAISLDLSYYENAAYFNTFHQAQRQASYRPVQILRNLTDFLKSSLLLISLSSLLIYLHWAISVILICFALPIAAVRWYYSRKMFEWEKNRTALEREAGYLNQVLTTDSYAKEVRIFNLGEILLDKFKGVRKSLFDEKYKINEQKAKAGVFAKTAEIVAMTMSYAFIAFRTFQGSITIGDLVMFFQAFQRGQGAIQQLLSSVVGLYNNRLFLSHLFDLLNVQSTLPRAKKPKLFTPLDKSIQLQNVNFTYPKTDKQVLKNINLKLEKGQVVAFVGENGSGKTTLIKLLCRLYDPNSGNINWDGTDIREMELQDLRKRISVIYQDFSKYQFSAGENIQIGDFGKPLSETKRKQAAEQSGASNFIESFPKQYDQKLGRWFKQGQELSGGQWQKIALARAFYKEAELIILDEPSSSIDPLAEAAIFERFKELAKDKILILITHRLYNLKLADKIVVLHDGEVKDIGNHEELMQTCELYKSMVEKQVSGLSEKE